METKYILNTGTGTLHIYNKCYHSRHTGAGMKEYKTKDQAIAENQNHIKECKNCFKGV